MVIPGLTAAYPASTYITPGRIVSVKASWTDEWQVIPFIDVVDIVVSDKNGSTSATFEWDYGMLIMPGFTVPEIWDFLNISGWYIKVEVYDSYGIDQIFYGIVDSETVSPFCTTDYPDGIQGFRASGLKSILYKKKIIGSYVNVGFDFLRNEFGDIDDSYTFTNYGTVAHIDRGIEFNADLNDIGTYNITS